MRAFPPLAEDHPARHDKCVICGEVLGVGAVTVLIPWGPARIEDAVRALEGRAHTVEAKIAHFSCLPAQLQALCSD